jgi:hypothetical protein
MAATSEDPRMEWKRSETHKPFVVSTVGRRASIGGRLNSGGALVKPIFVLGHQSLLLTSAPRGYDNS